MSDMGAMRCKGMHGIMPCQAMSCCVTQVFCWLLLGAGEVSVQEYCTPGAQGTQSYTNGMYLRHIEMAADRSGSNRPWMCCMGRAVAWGRQLHGAGSCRQHACNSPGC